MERMEAGKIHKVKEVIVTVVILVGEEVVIGQGRITAITTVLFSYH